MNQPNCLFCGKPADHKCCDAYDCGACCSMRGLLAHDSPLVYKWLENMIRPELLHLRSAPAQEALSDPHVLSAKEAVMSEPMSEERLQPETISLRSEEHTS